MSENVIDISITDGRYGPIGALTNQKQVYLWGANTYGQLGTGDTNSQYNPFKPKGAFQGKITRVQIAGGTNYGGCIIQCGNELWAAGYNAQGNLGIGHAASTNSIFQKVIGISGKIIDWNVYGYGTKDWGLSVLYDDGRVDACGYNSSYGETGTQSGNLHNVLQLTMFTSRSQE
ncbi:hypothetical protein [Bartonella sp. DGB2]|uniref:hypothetical protein n=1 Tax=Bartonella sp. DGB2 TaxID=3388426 RepID=UPI00398FA97D